MKRLLIVLGVFLAACGSTASQPPTNPPPPTATALPSRWINTTVEGCDFDGSTGVIVSGKIKNVSDDQTFTDIRVTATLRNEKSVLVNEYEGLIDDDQLTPGEEVAFRIPVTATNVGTVSCTAVVSRAQNVP